MGWGKASLKRCRRVIWNNGGMFSQSLTNETGHCRILGAEF